jgi:hypothetical protein
VHYGQSPGLVGFYDIKAISASRRRSPGGNS